MTNIQHNPPMELTVCVPGDGRVKLRSSCDACSVAKVKCDRQIQCERCRNNFIKCSYSPSRRHGKQSWSKRVAEQHQRYLQSTLYDQTPQVPAMSNPFPQLQQDGAAFAVPVAPMPASPQSPMGYSNLGDQLMAQPPADSHSINSSISLNGPWPMVHTNFPPAFPISPATTSTPVISEASMSPQLGPAFQAPPPPPHDCEALTLTTLQGLHQNYSPNIGPLSIHSQAPPELPQQIPPLDKILHFNRVALSTVQRLLECPCAHQPYLALQCMAIVAKTLSWYRIAANLSFKTVTPVFEPSNMSSPVSPVPNIFAADSTPITSAPVTSKSNTVQIGMFDLEEEDEAMVVRNVVITEVKKVGRLVELMRGGKIGSSAMSDFGQNQFSLDSWYKVGGEKLARDVQDTLRVIHGNVVPQTTQGMPMPGQ